MSVKTVYHTGSNICDHVFKPLKSMTVTEMANEFLYVSKIHRYEKIWLKEIRRAKQKPSQYVGYDDAMEIIPKYGIRKHQLRKRLRELGVLDLLRKMIVLENKSISN